MNARLHAELHRGGVARDLPPDLFLQSEPGRESRANLSYAMRDGFWHLSFVHCKFLTMEPEKPDPEREAIALLRADHERLLNLIAQLNSTTSRSRTKRKQLLSTVVEEVRAHLRLEEEIFYPALQRAAATSEDRRLLHEAVEGHRLVDAMLTSIEKVDPKSEMFGAKAAVLMTLIDHHASEEERETFPRARAILSEERLLELGAEIQRRKAQFAGG